MRAGAASFASRRKVVNFNVVVEFRSKFRNTFRRGEFHLRPCQLVSRERTPFRERSASNFSLLPLSSGSFARTRGDVVVM